MINIVYNLGRGAIHWSVMMTVYIILGIMTAYRVATKWDVSSSFHLACMLSVVGGLPLSFFIMMAISPALAIAVFATIGIIMLLTIGAALFSEI